MWKGLAIKRKKEGDRKGEGGGGEQDKEASNKTKQHKYRQNKDEP